MNIKVRKILRIIVIVLLIYCVLAAFSAFGFHGFADFPCGRPDYDEQNNCIVGSRAAYFNWDVNVRIESFLSVYSAGWSGGGCNYKFSETDSLIIKTSAGKLKLEIVDNQLMVNNKLLEKEEKYKRINVFNLNPWLVSELSFTNLGLVSDCDSNSTLQKAVIYGSYGTEGSLVKGFVILAILITALVLLKKGLKKPEQKKPGFFTYNKTKLWIFAILILITLAFAITLYQLETSHSSSSDLFAVATMPITMLLGFPLLFFGITVHTESLSASVFMAAIVELLYLYLLSCVIASIIKGIKKKKK